MGILRLGFISSYLSDQLVQGLTTAAAVEVFTNQIPLLFGIQNLPKTSRPLGIIKVCGFKNFQTQKSESKISVLHRIFSTYNRSKLGDDFNVRRMFGGFDFVPGTAGGAF